MPATVKLPFLLLACVLLMPDAVNGAGYPIRRADSSWGEYSAGLIDGNSFIAAGEAYGSRTGTKVSFIGKWDLEGNPIWEKSTRDWADDYRSIRKNPDGTYLLLGNSYPLITTTTVPSGTLCLTVDADGNTLSRAYLTGLSPSNPDSVAGDTPFYPGSLYTDFATVAGRRFILGGMPFVGDAPFLAEIDSGYRILHLVNLPQDSQEFRASKLLAWNGQLLVLGSGGHFNSPGSSNTDAAPTVLAVGLDGHVEKSVRIDGYSGWNGFITDGMVLGDKVLLSGNLFLAQLGPDLQVDWTRPLKPTKSEPTLLRRDGNGNLLVFIRDQRVDRTEGQSIQTFDPQGNPLQSSILSNDFAGDDFVPIPGGRLLALGFGIDSMTHSTVVNRVILFGYEINLHAESSDDSGFEHCTGGRGLRKRSIQSA